MAPQIKTEEPPGEQREVNLWWLYELRAQAYAAGIDKQQFSRMTMTEVLLAIDGNRENRYYAALPQENYRLSKYSKKDLKDTSVDAEYSKLAAARLEEFLSPYTPTYMLAKKQRGAILAAQGRGSAVRPIPHLSREAAAGLLEAMADMSMSVEAAGPLFKVYRELTVTADG